ncbi:MAG: DUF4157 domain-containing protein, partial [Gemmatimonadaceae bacterium]
MLRQGTRIDSPTGEREREAVNAAKGAPAPSRGSSGDASALPVTSELRADFGPGQPLDSTLRAQLGPMAHTNLDPVRVHTDAAAAESARALDAKAWTLGNDVFVGPTAPPLHSAEGHALLAHELTHVAQQSAGAPPRIAREPNTPGTTSYPQAALR